MQQLLLQRHELQRTLSLYSTHVQRQGNFYLDFFYHSFQVMKLFRIVIMYNISKRKCQKKTQVSLNLLNLIQPDRHNCVVIPPHWKYPIIGAEFFWDNTNLFFSETRYLQRRKRWSAIQNGTRRWRRLLSMDFGESHHLTTAQITSKTASTIKSRPTITAFSQRAVIRWVRRVRRWTDLFMKKKSIFGTAVKTFQPYLSQRKGYFCVEICDKS